MNLGLIPTSSLSWETACAALKPETGGTLHVHENVTSYSTTRNCNEVNDIEVEKQQLKTFEQSKTQLKFAKKTQSRPDWEQCAVEMCARLRSFLEQLHCNRWSCDVTHIEHVKSYAPHVDHLVFDVRCAPVSATPQPR